MSGTGLEPLDKANVQTLVDGIGERSMRYERSQQKLDKALIEFSEFWIVDTPEKDENGNPVDIPYQFQKENIPKFKKFTNEINRSMWVFSFVVKENRIQLHSQENLPPPTQLSNLPLGQSKPSDLKAMLGSFRDFTKKIYKDPDSPYNATKDEFEYLLEIPHQWINMLHIHYLSIVHRPKINTRHELDKIRDDVMVFFNAHLEPNLQAKKEEATNILIDKANDKIEKILTSYKELAERHEKMYAGMPQPP